jgi:hypothetical protein
MKSMAYIRFRNALSDIHQFQTYLNEEGGSLDQLTPEEREAAEKAINLCAKIADDWGPQ